MAQPNTILISRDIAEHHNLEVGAAITMIYAGKNYSAEIVGLLQPSDSLSRRRLENIILADISTAQEITGRIGQLSTIDLILPEDAEEQLSKIESVLPQDARVVPVEARSGSIGEMTAAFRTNLLALSLLALLVGLFLIYNTMTFSVIQRRSLFGTLRCIGTTREGIFLMVMIEALFIGLIGSVLGTGVGILLGQGAVRLVTQTINDLFFVVSVRGVQIPVESIIKGISIGVIATLVTAAPPAWEAASIPPRAALSRAGLEDKAKGAVRWTAVAGLVLIVLGVGILRIPTRDLVVSFTGTFAVVIGCAFS